MRFSSIVVLQLLSCASIGGVQSFGVTPASSIRATTARQSAATSSDLIPPPAVLEVESNVVADLYDRRVQKTYGRYPLTITHGKGCNLYDSEGKSYLDFVAGIATCILGHGNAELSEAISDQMQKLHHISNLYFIPEQAALADWLCANSCADKAFFCNSGAEANEGAIKLARRHAFDRGVTDPVIITAHNSFHGRTLAAITATGQPKYHKGFGYGGEMVRGFEYVTYNDEEELERMVKEINETPEDLKQQGRKRGVAAIMMEPLQGEGGIITGTPAFFNKARQLCDDNSALLMFDEVQIGMGRSGTLWGYQQLGGVEPDVFTSAKALGGGVPIGALMAGGEAANVFGPGDHASTYGGNPLACRAGLTVAKYLSDHDVLSNVKARGKQLRDGLTGLAEKYPLTLGEVRGWGLLLGVEVKEEAGVTAGELVGEAMGEGLLLVPAGATVVRFVPPLIVSEDEVDLALELFEKALVKRS